VAFQVARSLLLAVAFALGSSGCAGSSAQPAGTAVRSNAAPPDFELNALDGSSVRLSDYVGKHVILIDFWATYCDPCLRAMPSLDALYSKYKAQGLVVFGVAIDGPDSLAQVRADVQRLGVHFPILLDQDTRVVALYNPKTSAPFSVLIGKHGEVLLQKEGYTTGSSASLERDVAAALSAQ
jgi:peroxiredoxin